MVQCIYIFEVKPEKKGNDLEVTSKRRQISIFTRNHRKT